MTSWQRAVALKRASRARRAAAATSASLCALLLWASGWAADPAAAPSAAANPSAASLDRVMGLLAQQRHSEADFQETQYLAVLTRPLISTGVLIYEAPDHLEEHIVRPRRQAMVLDHGLLMMQVGKRRRSVQLSDYPALAPLIDSIRATLAGDRATLEGLFELKFSGTVAHWQLHLTPRATQLAATVQAIEIQGDGAAIHEVQVRQSDGDRSVMHIQPRE